MAELEFELEKPESATRKLPTVLWSLAYYVIGLVKKMEYLMIQRTC